MKAFSQKLEALLEELKNNNASAREKIKALVDHIKAIKHGSDAPEGLDSKRQKALWNNRSKWNAPEEEEAVIDLIRKIDDFIYQNAALNWQDPDSNASWDLRDDLQDLFPDMTEQDIYEVYRLAAQNS